MEEWLDSEEEQAFQKGISKGKEAVLTLNQQLFSNNRIDDLKRAINDATYRDWLLARILPYQTRKELTFVPKKITTMCDVIDNIKGKAFQRGVLQGVDTIFSMSFYLLIDNRINDLKKATEDKEFRKEILHEIWGGKLHQNFSGSALVLKSSETRWIKKNISENGY